LLRALRCGGGENVSSCWCHLTANGCFLELRQARGRRSLAAAVGGTVVSCQVCIGCWEKNFEAEEPLFPNIPRLNSK